MRELPARRPVPLRLLDWSEVYEEFPSRDLQTQASRCMDCGIPFCRTSCPLGNLIPEWNDLVERGGLRAYEVRMAGGRFEKVDSSDFALQCDLVLLAMSFICPERGTVSRGTDWAVGTGAEGAAGTDPDVFVAGDAGCGQSLIVWAIAEGRSCAAAVEAFLMGATALPSPITPTTVQLR